MSIWKAIIPIRSGSKSITNKNIKILHGKPLFYWATQAAIDSGIFNGGVFVASDNEEYLDFVRYYTPKAVPILRPLYTSTDDATSERVMEWFLEQQSCDVISLIQVTTPTVTPHDFIEAKNLFESKSADSLLTGVLFQRFIWSHSGKALNYDPLIRPRRQEMETQYMENGSFYFTRTELFSSVKCRLAGNISIYQMPIEAETEIDENSDWEKVERAFRLMKESDKELSMPSIIIVDVDGTLTDGGMYYSEHGEELKKFNTRDGAALKTLKDYGFVIVVCTGECSASVSKRMEKLGITNYLPGIEDKEKELSIWLIKHGYNWDEVLYIGDENNDEIPIRRAAFSACPSDANPAIRTLVSVVCDSKGGEGVIRDVLFWLKRRWPQLENKD